MFNVTKKLLQISARSLLIAAICLHLFLSIGTYFLARAQVFPAIQPNGVIQSVSPDSLDHICFAQQLADFISAGDLRTWYFSPLPINMKIYSLSFLVLSPLVGMSVLAGGPINLLLYISILILVFKIGSTVVNRDVGLVSAIAVGIWPSFLLHSTQLLKDQFFIAALLLIVFIMVHWLKKPKPSLVSIVLMTVGGAVGAYVIARTRSPYWALLIVVFILIGFVLLLIRQLLERQLFLGHMFTAVSIIIVLIATYSSTPRTSMQVVPSPHNPSTAPQTKSEPPEPTSQLTLKRRLDLTAVKIWQFRNDYQLLEGGAGTLDNGVVFADAGQLVKYLPRATMIGLFAPFPNQWFVEGRHSGRIARSIAAAEMLVAYVFGVFAVVAIWRLRKRLGTWLLVSISLVGVTTLALIVPNLGALFRMRYVFFILLLPLAISELLRLDDSSRKRDPNS